MPTISQLPAAQTITASDQIPLAQDGISRSASVGSLLADVQPAIRIESNKLIGRASVGIGGPEEITIGQGLVLSNGTLTTADGLLNSFDSTGTISAEDRLVIRRAGQLNVVPASAVRSLLAAGSHVTIDGNGTIAAVWPTAEDIGAGGSGDVTTLPRSQSLQASDLIPIQRGGVSQATSYSTLLNAQTIDQAAPASSTTDADLIWVAQSGNAMSRQSFSAIWSWIADKLPTARVSCVEIDQDTVLDATVHNGRVLVCTHPVRITPLVQNMGGGFHCEIINLAAGPVTFGPGVITAPGVTSLAPRRSADLRLLPLSSGNIVYASIHGGGTVAPVPSAVQTLSVGTVTTSTARLFWVEPATGSPPFTYTILYRSAGVITWISGPAGLTSPDGVVSSLTPGSAYEFVVIASNASGAGNMSTVVNATTQGAAVVPGQPVGLAAATQGVDSVSLAWGAPTSGGAVTGYNVQYRSSGSTLWINGPSGLSVRTAVVGGLSAATTYEFRVLAVNAGGTGPASTIVTAITQPPVGAVSSIQWNMAPIGPYTRGVGAIGVNVLVTPADGAVRFGFSTSATTPPTTWTLGVHVMTNLWGAYVDTPPVAGTWHAWAQGTDGSASTVHSTAFTVL